MDDYDISTKFDSYVASGDFEKASDLLRQTWSDYNQLPSMGMFRLAEFLKSAKKSEQYELVTKWARPVLTLLASADVPKWERENFFDRLDVGRGFYELVSNFPKQYRPDLADAYLEYAELLCKQPFNDERRDRIKWALLHAEWLDAKRKRETKTIAEWVQRLSDIPSWEYMSLDCSFQQGTWRLYLVDGQRIHNPDQSPTLAEHLKQKGTEGWELVTSLQTERKDVGVLLSLTLKRLHVAKRKQEEKKEGIGNILSEQLALFIIAPLLWIGIAVLVLTVMNGVIQSWFGRPAVAYSFTDILLVAILIGITLLLNGLSLLRERLREPTKHTELP